MAAAAAAAASQSSSGIAVGNRGLLLGTLNPHIESFRGSGPGMRVSDLKPSTIN